MPSTTPIAPISGRHVEVETPEHVAVPYELADLGSRFAALMLDGLVLASILLALWVGLPLLVILLGGLPAFLASTGLAMLIVLTFAVLWGYFTYYEGVRDGQTPGKRRLGLRVIQDGGYPVGARAALVRNLLRVVDILPPPTWLVGGVVMMLHPRTKRVGDLAAGTVVVRERGELAIPEEQAGAASSGPPRLPDDAFETVSRYVARRAALPPEARAKIAGQLARGVAGRLAEDDPRRRSLSADAYLVLLHGEELLRRGALGRAAGDPQAAALVRRQREKWAAYRALVERAGKRGLSSLPEEQVSKFASLYRETAADLARARSYGGSRELVYSLERWVGAGHNLLYRPGVRSLRQVGRWLAGGFPALVRRRRRPIALAALLLFGPMLAVGASVYAEPAWARRILPAEMLARAEEGEARRAGGLGYVDVPELGMPVMAGGIIANNVQVTFLAFAGGVLAGAGTAMTLVFNGVFIGAVFGLFAAYGLSDQLLAFVLPHGVVELAAISIAGGAGLYLGSALIAPGRLTRREALTRRAREAVGLVGGTAALLVVAGLIEGFVSPAPLPFAAKAGFSALSALLLAAYLFLGGRAREAEDQSSPRALTSR